MRIQYRVLKKKVFSFIGAELKTSQLIENDETRPLTKSKPLN